MKTIWEMTDVYGGQRFYPPGSHPASRALKEQAAALERLLERCERGLLPTDQVEDALTYVRDKIAAFEEGESVAKMHYARWLDRP